ncbi:TSUP family transporter [Kineococcus sp. NBC_00420]|uniref:TSUP family transporter n=1 Tax=Kineococcus sp. NBC_00420 TaxID=2903564 RepID=UPI002E1D02DA
MTVRDSGRCAVWDDPAVLMGEAVWLIVAVVVCVGVASAAQVLSGMGFALLAGPLLALALGTSDGVRLSVALSIVLNVVVLAGSWRLVRGGDALRLLVPAALLVLPAHLLSARLGGMWTSVAAGVAVLVGVGLIASGRRAGWVDGPAGAVAAGAGSGVLNVLGGVSGPPVALFVAHRGWEPKVSTATLQAYALPLNVVTLAVLGLPAVQLGSLLGAGVGLVVGAACAWRFVARISAATVRSLVLVLAAVGGVLLITRALT